MIFEIGCGSGYSTLTFLLCDFDVISIDANPSAVKMAKQFLTKHDYNLDDNVKLLNLDVVHDYKAVKDELENNPCDIILLCNPGGNTRTFLTNQEEKWLRWGNFLDDEFSVANLYRLHTYAVIYATCGLAMELDLPLIIVQRDSRERIQSTLQQIADDSEVRLLNKQLFERNQKSA